MQQAQDDSAWDRWPRRVRPLGTLDQHHGGTALRVEGSIYLPGQHLRLWGNSGTRVPPAFSQLIANTIAIGGSGELHMLTDFQRSDLKPVLQHKTAVLLVR